LYACEFGALRRIDSSWHFEELRHLHDTEKISGVNLKYAAELRTRPDQPCPCKEKFQQRSATVYRFLRNAATESDFEPKVENITPKSKCTCYAVSFFDTLESAQRRYSSLAASNDDGGATARDRFGDHIGEIVIGPDDGLMNFPHPRSGHVELHPAASALFASRVVVYTPCEYAESDDVA